MRRIMTNILWWLLIRKIPCEEWGVEDVNQQYRYWRLNDME